MIRANTKVALSQELDKSLCWLESFIEAKMLTGMRVGRSEDKRPTGTA